jgi:hypothetical protein
MRDPHWVSGESHLVRGAHAVTVTRRRSRCWRSPSRISKRIGWCNWSCPLGFATTDAVLARGNAWRESRAAKRKRHVARSRTTGEDGYRQSRSLWSPSCSPTGRTPSMNRGSGPTCRRRAAPCAFLWQTIPHTFGGFVPSRRPHGRRNAAPMERARTASDLDGGHAVLARSRLARTRRSRGRRAHQCSGVLITAMPTVRARGHASICRRAGIRRGRGGESWNRIRILAPHLSAFIAAIDRSPDRRA